MKRGSPFEIDRKPLIWLALASLIAVPTESTAVDFRRCAGVLRYLDEYAINAASAATRADDACDDYEDCKAFPDMYDFLDDGCESEKEDCDSAVRRLENALSEVGSQLWSLQPACGVTFTVQDDAAKKMEERLRQSPPSVEQPGPSKPSQPPDPDTRR